jgi:hypothetical protein
VGTSSALPIRLVAERVIRDVVKLNQLPATAGNTLAVVPAGVAFSRIARRLTSATASVPAHQPRDSSTAAAPVLATFLP